MQLIIRLIFRGLGLLPLAILQSLGAAVGYLLSLLPIRRVRRVRVNLALCLPELSEAERRQLGRQALINLGRTLFETPRLWFGPEKAVRKMFAQVENLELFERLQAEARLKGSGIVVLSPHLNWEVAVLFLGLQGPSTFLYKPQDPRVEQLIRQGRGRFGTRFVHAIPGNVREQLRERLQQGDSVLILPDQDPPLRRGIFAPFFKVPAHSPSIVGRLLQHSPAPVVLLQITRLPWGRGFRLRVLPAPASIASSDKEISVAAVNTAMETCIRSCPGQYMWNIPRFRHRPAGEPGVYRF